MQDTKIIFGTTKEFRRQLKLYSVHNDFHMSFIIREAIFEYLQRHKGKPCPLAIAVDGTGTEHVL
jgi:hypothetical protein